jgi:hypothetical protein
MPNVAFELAALRATRSRRVPGPARSAIEDVVHRVGRRVVDVEDGSGQAISVGWADGFEPNPQDGVLSVRRLSPSPLITLAACLGLCWLDRSEHPYPGATIAQDELLAVTSALGADRSHTLGALRHELRLAGLVELHLGQISLGPAIAAWAPAQIDALRRFADTLPGAADA